MLKRYRKFVTTGLGFVFAVVGGTGFIFQFYFKNKPLVFIHGWLGVALVAVALTHVTQNWTSLRAHLRDPRAWGSALATVLLTVGLAVVPRAKGFDAKAFARRTFDARAEVVALATNADLEVIAARMRAQGLKIEASATIRALASENKVTPETILSFFTP